MLTDYILQETINEIKKHESPTICYDNCFTDDQYEYMKNYAYELLNDPKICQIRNPNHPTPNLAAKFPDTKQTKIIHNEIIRSVHDMSIYDFSFSHIYKTYKEFDLHADSSHGKKTICWKQGVIPIDVEYIDDSIDSYTFFYNQKLYIGADLYWNTFKVDDKNKREHDKNIVILQNNFSQYIENMTNDYLSEEILEKYFYNNKKSNNEMKEWLKGFSIEKIFNWKFKSMAVADRSSVHSMTPFAKGIKWKIGFVWHSVYKK